MVVDAHAHIYPEINGLTGMGLTRSLGYGRASMGNIVRQVQPPFGDRTMFTPELLIAHLDWARVDRAVLLQGSTYGECNDYVLDAISRYPERLVGAAYFDPWSPNSRATFDDLVPIISRLCALKLECSVSSGLCGIHPNAKLDAPEIAWLWQELERREKVLVLDLGAVGSKSYQTDAVHSIAKSHPGLRIVIAHLAQPTPVAESDLNLWQSWLEQIDLGLLPNVWFDCASLIAFLPDEDYPYPTAARYLRLAIERIGPSKIMWGTDQPGNLKLATYPQFVKLARYHTSFLSPNEQAMVMGGTACAVYGM